MIHTFEQVAVRSYENAEGAAPGHESMLCAVFGSLDKVVTSELVAAAWDSSGVCLAILRPRAPYAPCNPT